MCTCTDANYMCIHRTSTTGCILCMCGVCYNTMDISGRALPGLIFPYLVSFLGVPHFFWGSSVCIDNNTWKWRRSEKRGRPRNIHHVNDIGWMQGVSGAHSRLSTFWISSFLRSTRFDYSTGKSRLQMLQITPTRQYLKLFVVRPHPSYVHPTSLM